jgi:DNA-binding response OmpR family regulator
MQILLVDDEALIRAPLAELLAREGYAVSEARDLDEARAVLATAPADLIITDSFSPVWGEAALGPVRQLLQAAAGAPVILLSAHAESKDLDLAEIGLAEVIVKPFALDQLLRRVRTVLDAHS